MKISWKQWRILEFLSGGRGSTAVKFFGSCECFNAPSHINSQIAVILGPTLAFCWQYCWPNSKLRNVFGSTSFANRSIIIANGMPTILDQTMRWAFNGSTWLKGISGIIFNYIQTWCSYLCVNAKCLFIIWE